MKKKKLTRVLALVLVIALLATTVISIIYSAEAEAAKDSYTIEMTFSEDMEALRAAQCLHYINDTGADLDRVMFCIYINLLRSRVTLFYEDESAFGYGFTPSGIEFTDVRVNGERADWGVSGEGSCCLRVACDLKDGESADFEFEYEIMLSDNRAFCGRGENDIHLSLFYPVACVYNDGIWEYNAPIQHTRFLLTDAADYDVKMTLPVDYEPAATGDCEKLSENDDTAVWQMKSENIRGFACVISRTWREYKCETELGTNIKILTSDRINGNTALKKAVKTADILESWFGKLPNDVVFADTDYYKNYCSYPGLVWVSDFSDCEYIINRALAEQYFGNCVYPDPVSDAWLNDAVCEYVNYLLTEETKGYDAMINALNKNILPSLQITIPGDKFITADASVFSQQEYDTAVNDRGCAVMHMLRDCTGREAFLGALRLYYENCAYKSFTLETDFLKAVNEASGRDWEKTLTDLLFNIDEFTNQQIFEFE